MTDNDRSYWLEVTGDGQPTAHGMRTLLSAKAIFVSVRSNGAGQMIADADHKSIAKQIKSIVKQVQERQHAVIFCHTEAWEKTILCAFQFDKEKQAWYWYSTWSDGRAKGTPTEGKANLVDTILYAIGLLAEIENRITLLEREIALQKKSNRLRAQLRKLEEQHPTPAVAA